MKIVINDELGTLDYYRRQLKEVQTDLSYYSCRMSELENDMEEYRNIGKNEPAERAFELWELYLKKKNYLESRKNALNELIVEFVLA